jgi:hypothetical protein
MMYSESMTDLEARPEFTVLFGEMVEVIADEYPNWLEED